MFELRAEHSIQPEEVEAVEIGLSQTGWNIIGDPISDKHSPKSVVDGQFSMPFCTLLAARGPYGLG